MRAGKTLFAQDLYGGAEPGSARARRASSPSLAWHSLFIRNLLIRPEAEELAAFAPELTIVDLPSFQADPARHGARSSTIIACDFSRGIVLIGGTSYAGEMKKSVFTYLNYRPARQTRHADALLGQHQRRPARRRSSSASPAPARRPSRPTPRAR